MLDWVTTLLEGLAALCARPRARASSSPGLSADRWVPGWACWPPRWCSLPCPPGRWPPTRAAGAPTQRAERPVSLFRRTQPDFLDPFVVPPNSAQPRLIDSTMGRFAPRDRSMRVSAVWACLRLRADLVSTLPVDVYRRVDGRAVEVPKPPVLVHPSAMHPMLNEWLYATQIDLDRYGNAFGRIVARDGAGRPAQIEPSDAAGGRCAWTGRPAGSSTGTWVAWSTTPTCGTSGSSSSPGFPWVCRRSAPRR